MKKNNLNIDILSVFVKKIFEKMKDRLISDVAAYNNVSALRKIDVFPILKFLISIMRKRRNRNFLPFIRLLHIISSVLVTSSNQIKYLWDACGKHCLKWVFKGIDKQGLNYLQLVRERSYQKESFVISICIWKYSDLFPLAR